MRKALLVVAIGSALLQAVPSHAQPLASCHGTAGPNGFPDNASLGGVCSASIPVAATTAARIRLVPGDAFTGVLTAKVTSAAYGGVAVTGVFVAGRLVNGMDEETITLVAEPDADWRLTVTAGEPTPMTTYLFPPLPGQVQVPGAGVGEFGAEVVPDVPDEPEA